MATYHVTHHARDDVDSEESVSVLVRHHLDESISVLVSLAPAVSRHGETTNLTTRRPRLATK